MEEYQVTRKDELPWGYWMVVVFLVCVFCAYVMYTQRQDGKIPEDGYFRSQKEIQQQQQQEQQQVQEAQSQQFQEELILTKTYHYDSKGKDKTVTFTVGQKVVMPKENVEQRFPYHEVAKGKIVRIEGEYLYVEDSNKDLDIFNFRWFAKDGIPHPK